MDEYLALAAACLGMPGAAQEDEVTERLEERWGVDIAGFSEIADALLVRTRPFPSELVEGELIQAYVRPSENRQALLSYVRRIIPPGEDWTDERAGRRGR